MEALKNTTPYVQGAFQNQPIAIILHGSRSGRTTRPGGGPWTTRDEFNSTRHYCVTNPDGLAWHATVGDDAYSVHMSARQWGYHARQESRVAMGVEFAQAREILDISDAQVRAFCAWFKAAVLPAWPTFNIAADGAMLGHSELASGKADGKSDVFRPADERLAQLKGRIIQELGGAGMDGTGGTATPTEDKANAAFKAYHQALPPAVRAYIGDIRYRGNLSGREGWGDRVIPFVRLDRALLGYINERVVNLTGRAIDDWETQNAKYIQRF